MNAKNIIAEAVKSNDDVKGAACVDEALIATVLAQYREKCRETFGKRKQPSA